MPRVEKAAELKLCPFCRNTANLVEKDGLPGLSWWRVVCGCCLIGTDEYPLKSSAIKAWNRRYEPPNPPLTLEELRELEGDPVWCALAQDGTASVAAWGIVENALEDVAGSGFRLAFEDYGGTGWLAYRRRPEEEAV